MKPRSAAPPDVSFVSTKTALGLPDRSATTASRTPLPEVPDEGVFVVARELEEAGELLLGHERHGRHSLVCVAQLDQALDVLKQTLPGLYALAIGGSMARGPVSSAFSCGPLPCCSRRRLGSAASTAACITRVTSWQVPWSVSSLPWQFDTGLPCAGSALRSVPTAKLSRFEPLKGVAHAALAP